MTYDEYIEAHGSDIPYEYLGDPGVIPNGCITLDVEIWKCPVCHREFYFLAQEKATGSRCRAEDCEGGELEYVREREEINIYIDRLTGELEM